MDFTITFLKYYWVGIQFTSPVLSALVVFIALLGYFVGRLEGWSRIDTFYYSCITATTVGYGDFPPRRNRSKLFAILIAFSGLLLTGIIVAIGLNALTYTFKNTDRAKNYLNKRELLYNVVDDGSATNKKESNDGE